MLTANALGIHNIHQEQRGDFIFISADHPADALIRMRIQ